jgi:hypothetical protein
VLICVVVDNMWAKSNDSCCCEERLKSALDFIQDRIPG